MEIHILRGDAAAVAPSSKPGRWADETEEFLQLDKTAPEPAFPSLLACFSAENC